MKAPPKKWTRLLAAFAAACVFTLPGGCFSDDPGGPDPVRPDSVVTMPGFSFVPFSLTIRAGRTVIYDFPADPHNVIFERITGAPADIQQTSNRMVARTFTVAGNFPYDCTLHPGMSGVIVVE